MARIERLNATVYWLTYSPFLEPFTTKPKTMEDLKPEGERIKATPCSLCPQPDDRPAPYDPGPGNAIYAIGELIRILIRIRDPMRRARFEQRRMVFKIFFVEDLPRAVMHTGRRAGSRSRRLRMRSGSLRIQRGRE